MTALCSGLPRKDALPVTSSIAPILYGLRRSGLCKSRNGRRGERERRATE